MIVDHQAHWYPPAYFEWILDRAAYPRAERGEGDNSFVLEPTAGQRWPIPRRFVDLELQLADMAAAGIDVSVVSPGAFGGEVGGLDPGEARETLELLNSETARAQREHPDRLVGLAVLPMHDCEAALAELDRSITQLGLHGVCILSNIGGRPIATAETRPIYQRIAELDVPIFLHPAQRSMASGAELSPAAEMGLGWMFDTSAAALSLVYTGVLDAFPELTVVHPHLGGTVPYVADRVMSYASVGPQPAQPLDHYLRERFYTDSVGATAAALRLAVETYGSTRVLFGSDYPWLDRKDARRFVETSLDEEVANVILRDNSVPGLVPGVTS